MNIKRLLIIALLLTACGPAELLQSSTPETRSTYRALGNAVYVIHDDDSNVTCWYVSVNSIDCIPDWQLKEPSND